MSFRRAVRGYSRGGLRFNSRRGFGLGGWSFSSDLCTLPSFLPTGRHYALVTSVALGEKKIN